MTNNRSIEIQFMRTFITGSFVNLCNGNVLSLYKDDLEDLICKDNKKEVESPSNLLFLFLASSARDVKTVTWSAM